MPEMIAWLADLKERSASSLGDSVGAPWIHPRVVSFSTRKQKDKWRGYGDGWDQRDTFQKPNREEKGGSHTVWVLFFDTPSESYVGKATAGTTRPQWDLVGQHAWAAAVVKREGKGKDLYIFDCDMEVPSEPRTVRVKELQTQRQRVSIGEVRKWDFSLEQIFVGNAGEENAGVDACLRTATEWVEKIALAGPPRHAGGSGTLEQVLDDFVEIKL